MRYLGDARLLQDCCKARKVFVCDVRVRHPPICLTKAARLPQGHRAMNLCFIARMLRNVRLLLKISQWLHCGYSTTSCCSLANPSCCSLACEHEIIIQTLYCCLTLWVDLHGLCANLSAPCLTVLSSVACGKIAQTNNFMINVKQA